MPPKVVLDTNIYISAILFGGHPEEILNLARLGFISIFISPHLIQEIKKVLREKFQWSEKQIQETIDTIQNFAYLIEPKTKISKIKEDKADNRVLECALTSKANYIVSGDRHLLVLKRFRQIKILSPFDFLTLI